MLQPPPPPEGSDREVDRERILAVGSFGTGKSNNWLQIAKWAQQTGSPAQFYVIDSDVAIHRMLSGERFRGLKNVHVAEVFEWREYTGALETYLGKATSDDWIITDFVGSSWDAVQEWYVDQMFHQDIDEFYMDARKNMRKGSPLDGYKDWGIINKAHRKFMNDMIHKNPAHIYMTAVGEQLRDTDSKEVKSVFGAFGVRPKGQKHLGHQVHTILLMQTMRPGEWIMSTVKDRERSIHEATRVKDFVIDYLVATAGWRL